MEYQLSSDNVESHSDAITQDKPRRTRSKFSSVNSRLDPNFDIRELMKCKDEETKSRNTVPNPRTIEFEKLVCLLHPAFILEYLEKILSYLTSPMTKISFENIALYKEVLLVRLCQEKSNLNCEKFSEEARKVARQILEVVKANQNIYEWICKYEQGIFGPGALVYEKVYYTSENLRIPISNGSNVTGPPLRLIQSSNANGDSNTQDVIMAANKAHMLNTLLKFIKDNTNLRLKYPHLHISQANLLASLISQDKVIDTEVGFGCKSMYAPLCEALNAYKGVYDFDIRFKADSDTTVLMTLQKIPKSTKMDLSSPKQNSHGDQKSKISNASDNSQNTDHSKSSKKMTVLIFVGAIEEAFISTSLKEVLDFMEDESMASLDFTKLTKEKCGYLSRILQYSREVRFHDQFSPADRALLKKIHAASNSRDWKLAIEVRKMDRATRSQNITMRKEPYYRDKCKPAAQTTARSPRGEKSKPTAQVASQSLTEHITARSPQGEKSKPTAQVALQSLTAQTTASSSRGEKSKPTAQVASLIVQTTASSPRGTKTPAKAKPISFQSGGAIDTVQDVEVENTTEKTEKPMDDVAKLVAHNKRKSRLLADMSVPLDCDKGERMLRLMGWQGGALGLRGEGITEPIIPALHIATGAGLGHIKHVQTTLTILEFRWQFLNSVLSFIREEENETTLEYTECLSKAKMRSVNHIIQSLKGISGGFKHAREKQIFDKLLEEMRKQGKQVDGHVSSPDYKKIKLTKVPLKAKQLKNKLDSTLNNRAATLLCNPIRTVIQNTNSPDDCITAEIITENEIMALKERVNLECYIETPKSAQKLALKLIFLRKLRDFLQRGFEKRRYVFEQWIKISNKLKSYFSSVILNVNKKVPRLENNLENSIYGDIKKATPSGCYLCVSVEDRNFTLQKKLKNSKKKKKNNSARDLPPPKSTDLKNTIIYQNNKIISYNGVVKDNNDDDDLILIEKKIDVFEISDDEDNEMKVDSEIDGTARTENSGNTEEKLTYSLDESLISIESLQDLSTSHETLLLETVEDDFKEKTDIVDMELANDIKELEQALLDCGFVCDEDVKQIFDVKLELETPEDNCKDKGIKMVELKLENDVVQPKKESVDTNDWCINVKPTTDKNFYVLQPLNNISKTTTEVENEDPTRVRNESQSFLHLNMKGNIKQITENIINAGTINNSTENSQLSAEDDEDDHGEKDSFDEIKNRLETNKEDSYKNIEVTDMINEFPIQIPDSLQKSKDDKCLNATKTDLFECYKDRSPGVGKRSRPSTLNSEAESVSKKCKTQIRSLRITCKEPDEDLNLKIREVQSVISENIDIIIDNVDFLPRLECHGVKNGGLIYSCHDDKTFAWLTNFVLSDLDVNVTETDYNLNKTFMMEIKIYNFEDVDKTLNRIKLYNPELDTSLWRVKVKKEFEDFVMITVEIDRESFERIHENNNSLFAGVDKAKFNIVWS